MKYKGYLISHVGKVRDKNQDNYYLDGIYRKKDSNRISVEAKESYDNVLAAVFDGLGGEQKGEVASRIAATCMDEFRNNYYNYDITVYAENANKQIMEYDNKLTMGTTYVALQIINNTMIFSNIGDSRGYLFRNNQLMQMSKDHTVIQHLLENNIISETQAEHHFQRHMLSQYLGMREEGYEIVPEPYVAERMKVIPGDMFLMCTDGLTDAMKEKELLTILAGKENVTEKVQLMLGYALERGGKDNITIMLIEAV